MQTGELVWLMKGSPIYEMLAKTDGGTTRHYAGYIPEVTMGIEVERVEEMGVEHPGQSEARVLAVVAGPDGRSAGVDEDGSLEAAGWGRRGRAVKPGDLVKCSGSCYDAPINHHNAGLAIRHYVGFITDGSLGVIVSEDSVHYEFDQPRVWYQVLTGGRSVWVNGSGVRSV